MNANQPPLRLLLLVIAVLLVGSLALVVRADFPATVNAPGEPLLSAFEPPEGAGHVIDLIARYGDPGLYQPLRGSSVISTPRGPVEFPLDELGDVALINIEELAVADPGCASCVTSTFRLWRCWAR
jgi:hypothetical protein